MNRESPMAQILFWIFALSTLWLVSEGSLYRLIFGATAIISIFIIQSIEFTRKVGNDTQILVDQLISLNKKMNDANEALESISLNSNNSSEED